MKKLVLYFVFICITTLAFGQTKQKITKSDVSYKVKNMGFNSTGTIAGFEAAIMFDKDHLATSNIVASVETHTIDSDNDMRDAHLKKEEYFDADKYPKITMKSVSFVRKGGSNYVGQFDVTIKGITKRVEVPFTYVVNGNAGTFNGGFKFNRLDFNIGDKSMVLSNEISITLNVETALN